MFIKDRQVDPMVIRMETGCPDYTLYWQSTPIFKLRFAGLDARNARCKFNSGIRNFLTRGVTQRSTLVTMACLHFSPDGRIHSQDVIHKPPDRPTTKELAHRSIGRDFPNIPPCQPDLPASPDKFKGDLGPGITRSNH